MRSIVLLASFTFVLAVAACGKSGEPFGGGHGGTGAATGHGAGGAGASTSTSTASGTSSGGAGTSTASGTSSGGTTTSSGSAGGGGDAGPGCGACAANEVCVAGQCLSACEAALAVPSNAGCEHWAVDLDQKDYGGNDPASASWGLLLASAGAGSATVTIEINTAPAGQPVVLELVTQVTVAAGALVPVALPTRELDCGAQPNDVNAPGTCLSSRAFRVTSTAPIVAYQINTLTNAYSADASLLLPKGALGKVYRVLGWQAAHPVPSSFPGIGTIVDRAFVTIVGTVPGTQVKVKPSFRIKGNAPIAATPAGGDVIVTLGPFDVLNLETDDATSADAPATRSDLSGTLVEASAPVAVFSGAETAGAPYGFLTVPTFDPSVGGDPCCTDHLEEQLLPVTALGTRYVVARSPLRSTGGFREPDIIRFVGATETAQVHTGLPAPFDTFTLQPGEVRTTWAQNNFVVTSDKPLLVGQILAGKGAVQGTQVGDPSLVVLPPVEQMRTEIVLLAPSGWAQSHVVVVAPVGASPLIDGAPTDTCVIEPAGGIDGVAYESRRCAVLEGRHRITASAPFSAVAYGYNDGSSYALPGGTNASALP